MAGPSRWVCGLSQPPQRRARSWRNSTAAHRMDALPPPTAAPPAALPNPPGASLRRQAYLRLPQGGHIFEEPVALIFCLLVRIGVAPHLSAFEIHQAAFAGQGKGPRE